MTKLIPSSIILSTFTQNMTMWQGDTDRDMAGEMTTWQGDMVGKIVFQGAKQLSQTQYPYKFHLKMKYSKKSVKCKKVKQQNILV